MENIVVGTHNGASVYLRDVAKVVDSVEERAQKTYSNGVQGAMIVVQKQSGANSVAISQKVIDMLPQLQKSLPSDVKLGIIVNTSDNILNTIDSLEETIMYAMLFVILVVFVFGALACHGHHLYHHTDVTGCLVHLSGYHRRRFTEYHLALLSLYCYW